MENIAGEQGASNLAILLFSVCLFHFWYPFCATTICMIDKVMCPRHAKSQSLSVSTAKSKQMLIFFDTQVKICLMQQVGK